jgi:hypothetical protein
MVRDLLYSSSALALSTASESKLLTYVNSVADLVHWTRNLSKKCYTTQHWIATEAEHALDRAVRVLNNSITGGHTVTQADQQERQDYPPESALLAIFGDLLKKKLARKIRDNLETLIVNLFVRIQPPLTVDDYESKIVASDSGQVVNWILQVCQQLPKGSSSNTKKRKRSHTPASDEQVVGQNNVLSRDVDVEQSAYVEVFPMAVSNQASFHDAEEMESEVVL